VKDSNHGKANATPAPRRNFRRSSEDIFMVFSPY
jgi:hypothetical protein